MLNILELQFQNLRTEITGNELVSTTQISYISEKRGEKENQLFQVCFLHTSTDMHTTNTAEFNPKNHKCITALPKLTKIPSLQGCSYTCAQPKIP